MAQGSTEIEPLIEYLPHQKQEGAYPKTTKPNSFPKHSKVDILDEQWTIRRDVPSLGKSELSNHELVVDDKGTPFLLPKNMIENEANEDNWCVFGRECARLFVNALALDSQGNLYVGGSIYQYLSDPNLTGIIKWDGEKWSSLGEGLNGKVNDIQIDENDHLYVGGAFRKAGNQEYAHNIAKWDGNEWSALSSGLDREVHCIYMAEDGNVYVGGKFTATGSNYPVQKFARWDGTSWNSLNADFNTTVEAIAVDQNGIIYAGGAFRHNGNGSLYNYIAQYDGISWTTLDRGLNSVVTDILIGPNNEVYVSGSFLDAGGDTNADRIAVWDGDAWQSLGTGLNHSVNDMEFDDNGNLVVVGWFTDAGGDMQADRVAKWNGSTWSSSAPITNNFVTRLEIAPSGELFLAGSFENLENDFTKTRLVKWDGQELSDFCEEPGNGLRGTVFDMAQGINGEVYIASFDNSTAEDPNLSSIRIWNGVDYEPIGEGISNGSVEAIAISDDGVIYVGGEFKNANGNPQMDYVAQWNGVSWEPVGFGFNRKVNDLIIDDDGVLYAAGDFTFAGSDPDANYIAKWDGTSWSALGSGFDDNAYALSLDANGDLLVGGRFESVDGDPSMDHIARWDGVAWHSVGGGLSSPVYAIELAYSGDVYIGGSFYNVGNSGESAGVVKWDGNNFTPLGSITSSVQSITIDANGTLFAGGYFTNMDGVPNTEYIARWDGYNWYSLGKGIDGPVLSLESFGTSDIFIGGSFLNVGDHKSHRIAIWKDPGCSDPILSPIENQIICVDSTFDLTSIVLVDENPATNMELGNISFHTNEFPISSTDQVVLDPLAVAVDTYYIRKEVIGGCAGIQRVIIEADEALPVAICQNIIVDLDENGTIIILPEMVDNGSYANCTDSSALVRLIKNEGDTDWSQELEFDCLDIGLNNVQFKVSHSDGNPNEDICNATITIQDTIKPELICPDDLAITLGEEICSIDNVDLGQALASDNCEIEELSNNAPIEFFQDTTEVTWMLTDLSGNISTCVQMIDVSIEQIELTGTIEGPTKVCQNDQSFFYNLNTPLTFDEYEWTFERLGSNGHTTQGTGKTVRMVFLFGPNQGTLRVRGIDGCGNLTTPVELLIEIEDETVCASYDCAQLNLNIDNAAIDVTALSEFKAIEILNSNAQLNYDKDFKFQAGQSIILAPNFEVSDSDKFAAIIEECDPD